MDKEKAPLVVLSVFLALMLAIVILVMGDVWLALKPVKATLDYWETISSIARNFGLVVAGIIALVIAWQRAKAADAQTKIADDQAKLVERGQNTDRYQKSAELLGSKKISVREAGIYALADLVRQDAENYYIPVQSLLCAFIRDRSDENLSDIWEAAENVAEQQLRIHGIDRLVQDGDAEPNFVVCTSDITEALHAFSKIRTAENLQRERASNWHPNLQAAYFVGLNAQETRINFEGARLKGAHLNRATFLDPNFRGVTFYGMDISKMRIFGPSGDQDRWPEGYRMVLYGDGTGKYVRKKLPLLKVKKGPGFKQI